MQDLTRMTRRLPVMAMALTIAMLGACSKDDTAPVVPTALTVASGNNQVVTAGKAIADPLMVTLKDQNGSPISGATVTWAILSGGGALDAATTTTDANGLAKAVYTAGTTAGPVTITATASTLTPASFTVTVNPDQPAAITMVGGDQQNAPAGQLLAQPLVVKVVDQYGNPIAGVTVSWSTNEGTLSAASTMTDATGQASIQLTLGSDATGPVTVTAAIDGVGNVSFTENAS
jgi:Bacterial Ig-like domain (group 1)